jgi:hypothetical protein
MPRSPAVGFSIPSVCSMGGMGGSFQVAQKAVVNSRASTAYATVTPAPCDQMPKIRPATSGPNTPPAVVVV